MINLFLQELQRSKKIEKNEYIVVNYNSLIKQLEMAVMDRYEFSKSMFLFKDIVVGVSMFDCKTFGFLGDSEEFLQSTNKSKRNGKYLGSDNAETNNARMIDDELYAQVSKGANSTSDLQANSSLINIDETKIQSDAQVVRDNSLNSGKEHQLYIYLDLSTGNVSSIMGETDGNSNVELSSFPASSIGANFVDNSDSPRTKILIGQAHGHPASDDPNMITQKTMSKGFDVPTAQNMQIGIYGLDAMDGRAGKSAGIHRANPDGTINNKVGKTIGVGTNAKNPPFNFGIDALKIWGKSGTPKY